MTTTDIYFKCTNQRRKKTIPNKWAPLTETHTHTQSTKKRKISDSKMAKSHNTAPHNVFLISFGFLIWAVIFVFVSTNRIILIVFTNKVALCCWCFDDEMNSEKCEPRACIVYWLSFFYSNLLGLFLFVVCGTFSHWTQNWMRFLTRARAPISWIAFWMTGQFTWKKNWINSNKTNTANYKVQKIMLKWKILSCICSISVAMLLPLHINAATLILALFFCSTASCEKSFWCSFTD